MRNDNVRVFFPVGMGGFSFERMDETTVVYDCGSTSAKVIKDNIKALKSDFFGAKDRVIDHLFISHFDSDHRNGVETLQSLFDVKEIHLPYIDYKQGLLKISPSPADQYVARPPRQVRHERLAEKFEKSNDGRQKFPQELHNVLCEVAHAVPAFCRIWAFGPDVVRIIASF